MAVNALQSSATGLSALNTKLDVIAHNLANVNTHGYKASRANFQDLLYIERAQPGIENANGDERPTGLYIGLGVKVSGTQVNFEQGSPLNTGQEFDVMVQGLGFFRVRADEQPGGFAYTRAGAFTRNSDGELVMVNDQGRRLEPTITIPDNVIKTQIDANGRVFIFQPGNTQPQEIGQINLHGFVNPTGLAQIGENLFIESPGSGAPIESVPGENNFGTLKQGLLESSNVDPAFELVEMIRTQRAFELNSNSIRAADDTLRTVAQLRR